MQRGQFWLDDPERSGATRRRALGLRPVPPLSSRPFGFHPSRLRACGAAHYVCLRGKPCGLSPPRAAWRPLIPPNRLRRIGPASVPPRWTGAGEHAGACCGRLFGCVPSSTLAVLAHHVTKDGSRTSRPASLWSFHATPQNRRRKVRQGRSRLSLGG